MLQAIREKAQGWIAWAIVILISIPFALFGIQQYLGVDANPPVAKVNGDEITAQQLDQRVRDFRENMRRALGDAYIPAMFEEATIKPQVLQRMIDETLLRQAADDWNMRISDAQLTAYIRSIPQLQTNGHFDAGLYEVTVRNQGLTQAGFEAMLRSDMLAQQQQEGIRDSVILTDSAFAELVRLSDQKRQVSYVRIPAADFVDKGSVTEKDALAYYQSHQREYLSPERVKLAYIRLSAADLTDQVEVNEADLRSYFDTHRDEFVANQERRVRHILIESTKKDDAEKHALAEQLLKELRDGADFATLAKKYSDDPGSAEDGGDLGWVNRGVMVKPFEDAVFAARKGELIGPVKTEYGYHIILVTDIRGGEEAGFEQVRKQVEQTYRQQQAEELYYTYFERLADLAYETPDSLVPVAEALDLKVEQTGWVTRNKPAPGLDSPKVMNAAFSEEVLQEGNNSDVIELSPTEAVVLRVAEHEEQTTKPFESVKQQVFEAVATARASNKAREEGERMLEKLRGGASLDSVLAKHPWKVQKIELSRASTEVPAELVDAVFSVPAVEHKGISYTGVVSAEGDYILAGVGDIINGDVSALSDAERTQRRNEQSRVLGGREFKGVLEALRARADIELLLKQGG